jgi:lysophospholipase L1-like esterase
MLCSTVSSKLSSWICLQYFPADAAQQPLLATIFFGANDAARPDGHSRRQHAPVATYAATLRSMATTLLRRGVKHVVLMTPPPIEESMRVAANRARMHALTSNVTDGKGDQATRGPPQIPEGLEANGLDKAERTDELARQYGNACSDVRFLHHVLSTYLF